MNKTQSGRQTAWPIPLLLLIVPWLFLMLWIPPFTLVMWVPILLGVELHVLVLDHGLVVCYALLLGAAALNVGHALGSLRRRELGRMRRALLVLRCGGIVTYPALAWGTLLSIFFLMGPDRNKHMLVLMVLSVAALNWVGACYALPLIVRLKDTHRISTVAAVCYTAMQLVVGLDIVATLLLYKKLRGLVDGDA